MVEIPFEPNPPVRGSTVMESREIDIGSGITAIFVHSSDGWRLDAWKGTPIERSTSAEVRLPEPGTEWVRRRFVTLEEAVEAFAGEAQRRSTPRVLRQN